MANPYTDWQSPWGFNLYGQPGSAGAATSTKAPKPPSFDQQLAAQEDLLRTGAANIGAEENRRYQQGANTAGGAYQDLRTSLSSLVDPNLLFSKATDAVGARTTADLDALRRSLGVRGISPNSGAAQGLLSRVLFNRDNSIAGATRDVAIENQREKQANAATQFAAALNLANYQNAPVSQIGYDTEQDIFEGLLTRYGIDKQAKSQKKSSKASTTGAAIGGAGQVLSGLIP